MLNAGSRREMSADEKASFSGDAVWGPITGPRSIYRFLGTKRDIKTGKKSRNYPRGAFWVSAAVVQILRTELLDQMEFELAGQRPRPGHSSPLNFIRDGLAVSEEWNSFDSLIQLPLRQGQSLGAWSGVTEWQLAYQAKPGGPQLSGGFVQYVVPGMEALPESAFRRYSLTTVWEMLSRNIGAFG
jgi:hypothetical protein